MPAKARMTRLASTASACQLALFLAQSRSCFILGPGEKESARFFYLRYHSSVDTNLPNQQSPSQSIPRLPRRRRRLAPTFT